MGEGRQSLLGACSSGALVCNVVYKAGWHFNALFFRLEDGLLDDGGG